MRYLDYTAITTGGTAYDIRFPLHPGTGSQEAVSEMVSAILGALSATLGTKDAVSDGDVLQALAMAVAIRARIADAKPAASLRLTHELINDAFAAALDATRYPAARS
jgi:hypothetical protein